MVKHDQGKQRAGLVLAGFSKSLRGVVEVGTFGADKYTPNGWKTVPNAFERYQDAMMRHWLAYQSGELVDDESGLSHLKHMAWNALALVHFEEFREWTDHDGSGKIPDGIKPYDK